MWDLGSLTRDGTHASCIGSAESQPLDREGSPRPCIFLLGNFVKDFGMGKDSTVETVQCSLECNLPGYLILLGPVHFIVFEPFTTVQVLEN